MKKLFLLMAVFLMPALASAQTMQTYTGTIKDLSGAVVTSGQVKFTLTPSVDSTISDIGRFIPTTTTCGINGDGTLSGLVSGVPSGSCQVVADTSLTPLGTSYKICIQAQFATLGSCFYDYAFGGTKDISPIITTPSRGPINYGGVAGPPRPTGAAGPAGTVSATRVGGNFLVSGKLSANVNNWQSPTSQGIISQGSTNTILSTGTAASGSLALSAASDFVVGNGVMIAHAGAPCGSVKGGNCSSPPTPVVTVKGTPGSTSYIYRLACIDGLGGTGSVGVGGATSVGNATLAGVVLANTVSGNYNAVTWSGHSACFEVAIYRNNALIATEYSAPSGTMTYNDTGVAAWTNRDLPSIPPPAPLNDNYIGLITAIETTTAMVSPVLGASVSGAKLYHSDTPLIQASINAHSGSIDLGSNTYLVNYPINFTKRGGAIIGSSSLIADTGDIFMDLTGGTFEQLQGFSIVPGHTNLSSIALYCARDTTIGGDTAQLLNTHQITIASLGGNTHALGGRGSVGYYNHACEIQQHNADHIEADRLFVLTAGNIDHVSSLFDANDDASFQSMSAIDILSLTGSTALGAFGELDNAYSVNWIGGYGLGGNSATHPWAFEFDAGQSGRFKLDAFRIENRGGAIYVAPGTTLHEPWLNADIYRANASTAQIFLGAGSTLSNADMVRLDDYGGSSIIVPLIDGGAGCIVSGSNLRMAVWESLGTCQLSGLGNTITGASLAIPSFDYSLNPDYTLVTSSSNTWVKLGTWVANPNGDTLGIRLYSGQGGNAGQNQQAFADIIVRNAKGGSAPNISGASLLSYGANPFFSLKVVATGASTSPTNQSWDIYVQETSFSQGTYHVEKQYSDQWINSNTLASDPGAASSTVVVGSIQQILSGYAGSTGALPGTTISAGACAILTASIAGATSGMVVIATPASTTQLIAGLHWDTAYVSAVGTVRVPVCNTTAAPITPNITPAFNVRVIQ
jgi:hypothetical protein